LDRGVVSVVPVLRRVSRAWAWIQSHPAAADAALAAALLGAAVWSSHVMTTDLLSGGNSQFQAPDATENIAGLAAVVLPLALRRRAPLTVLLASTAAFIAYVVLLGPVVEQSITWNSPDFPDTWALAMSKPRKDGVQHAEVSSAVSRGVPP
jgi:hypothetical protein